MSFTLRRWQENDVESVAKYANNKKIADNLRNVFPYPYTQEDACGYIMAMIAAGDSRQYACAIDVDGDAVGSIGVFLEDDIYCKNAELGYWLAEPYWGRGIMSEAIVRITNEAFNRYDIFRIHAEPFAHNIGSRRALEKAGFVLEGTFKKRIFKNSMVFDSCMYGITR